MTKSWLRPGILACCALVGCGSSPPTHFYILNEIAPAAQAPSAASNQIPVRVEPITIAPELDRPELVSRSGPNRVHVASSKRWAAPLSDQIRRVLSDDLAARLPPGLIVDPYEPAATEPRRSLTIAIEEFYGDDSCAVSLHASWSLTTSTAMGPRRAERIQIPASAPCDEGLPAAMSRAIGALADRLAAVIVAN